MAQQGSRWIEFSRHLAAAVGYAAGFVVLREVSFSHWLLFSGFRLCLLLLVPYRFWPALIVGEFVPLATIAMTHSDKYGSLWSMLYMIPPVALSMPIVAACRRWWQLVDGRGQTNILVLLACALACAGLWTLTNLMTLSETRFPANYPQLSFTVYAARWFVGNFLGVLTIVPAVLSLREMAMTGAQGWRHVIGSDLVLDLLRLVTPCLTLLVCLGLSAEQESLRQAARMAMFLPVIVLAIRYGWHGAALGGALASVAIVLTMPARYDSGTLQAQIFMSFAITTMLLLGDRIAELSRTQGTGRGDVQVAFALAQRNLLLGEMQLRQTSTALEHVREGVQAAYGQLLDRMRHMLPEADERDYRMRAAVAQQQLFRLADSLHPVMWREEGLAAALRQGAIARALDESGIRYWCDVQEREVGSLGHGVQVALYRSVCDLVAHLGARRDVGSIRIRIRAGGNESLRWIFARVDGLLEPPPSSPFAAHEDLLLRLSATGMGLDSIRDRAAIYGGLVRARQVSNGQRIGLLLKDESPFALNA